jgi:AcrR family transcriptional regulator
MTESVESPVRRRSQGERRAATRAALLDATLEALVETGYAGLTTADVAARAGVTRGAQAHYFATRTELVVEALDHLTGRLVDDLVGSPPRAAGRAEQEQYGALIDRLWELLSGPAVIALTELLVASRTDAELRARLQRFDHEVAQTLHTAAEAVAPDLVARPDFRPLMTTAIATVRGLWLLRGLGTDQSVRRLWPAAREQLVAGLDTAMPDTAMPNSSMPDTTPLDTPTEGRP